MKDHIPTVCAREVGAAVKRIRERAGLDRAAVARMVGCSVSRLSRLESGKRLGSETQIAVLLGACRATGAEVDEVLRLCRQAHTRTWLHHHHAWSPDTVEMLTRQETITATIVEYAPQAVPSLLHTADYARALSQPLTGHDTAEAWVQAQMRRQAAVRQHRQPTFEFFISEQCLHRPETDPQIMNDQLQHIALVSTLPHYQIRLVPTHHDVAIPPFRLLTYAHYNPVVHLPNLTTNLFLEEPDDIDTYHAMVARLHHLALDPNQSHQRLQHMADQFDTLAEQLAQGDQPVHGGQSWPARTDHISSSPPAHPQHGGLPQQTRGSLVHNDPGELIAAIPGLLRFTPIDSVILITYTDNGAGRLDLEAVLRMDLPEHLANAASQLRLIAVNHDATTVDLVVLGGGHPTPSGPPHRDLITTLTNTFHRAGITCAHTIWAPTTHPDDTWHSYHDPKDSGRIGNPTDMPTTAGRVPSPSRADLAAHLAPDPDDVLTRRAALLATQPIVDPARDLPFLRNTIDAITTNPDTDLDLDLDDETIVRLAHTLSHVDAQESCLAFALTTRAPAAEKLWTTLTRTAPAPARAEPAAHLAVCAYLRGEGTLAGLATDTALTINPHHSLAGTVRQIMDIGLPPHKFRTLLTNSFNAAHTNRTHTPPTQPQPTNNDH